MRWQGNTSLSKGFIVFLIGFIIFVGEIFPVWIERIEGNTPGIDGAKESMFASWDMFIPTIVIYTLLATFFWWLYRKLNWTLVVFLAAGLGTILEFVLFRPQESAGPNVVDNPIGALLFFLVIWPILLVLPYGIYQGWHRWLQTKSWPDYFKRRLTLIIVSIIVGLIMVIELILR